jgi:hypothetical protein
MRLKDLAITASLMAATSIAAASIALSHAAKIGVNGGPQADAGSYHVEVVPQGTTIAVFLRDHSDKAVTTDGYKGVAIFVIGGKPQRIPLAPAGENKLTGTSAVDLPKMPKGAVQITTPTGSTVQAKFD